MDRVEVRRGLTRYADALALVFVVGVGAALRVVFFDRAPVFIGGDTSQYYLPAHALLNGEGFPLPLKRPPLYPLFMALVGRALGPDLHVLVAVQHVLGLATAALAYGIGRLCFGRVVGLLSGLVAAVSGALLIFEHYVLTESLFTFLLALAVFLVLLGLRRTARGWYVAGGLAIGLATLTRPHAQVLLLIVPLVAAIWYRRWRPTARATVLTLGAAALVLLPWMVRNKLVHDTFAIVGAVGQNLVFRTANLQAGKFVFYDPEHPARDADPRRLQARKLLQSIADSKVRRPATNVSNRELHARVMKELGVGEAEADAIMRDVALDAVRARPWTFARVVLEDFWRILVGEPDRLAYHWKLRERSNGPAGLELSEIAGDVTPDQERGFPLTERLVTIYQSARLGPLLPLLFFVGLLVSAAVPARRVALLVGLTVLGLHAASAVAVGYVARFHHPADPLLHVVAIGGAVAVTRAVGSRVGRLSTWRSRATRPKVSGALPG